MVDLYERSDIIEALRDVPPRHRAVFTDHIAAVMFDQVQDKFAPGSDYAKQVIASALGKVRSAQGVPDAPAKDTRTPDQIVREAVEKRHGPQKSYITLQRLMSAMRDELYPAGNDPMRHANPAGARVKRAAPHDPSKPRNPLALLIEANRPSNATSGLLRELDNAKRAMATHGRGTEIGRIAESRMLTLRAQIIARGVTPP
jgi:hypothetical protein